MDEGRWLVEHRMEMDRAEAVWLEKLAEFDRDGLSELDGQLSCATWLVWRANMARSTAFEKLRVAHELERRPTVAEAFRDGRLTYSAVRVITRIDRPDADVDRALVELASREASILDVERVVRSYQLYADQERPPAEEVDLERDVRVRTGDDGTGQLVVTLNDLELEEFAATFQHSGIFASESSLWTSLQWRTPTRREDRRRPTPSWTWSQPGSSTWMVAAPRVMTAT